MNDTTLFRADSSSTLGTGHIMRDLVLASKYAKEGHTIVFATQDLEGNINHRIAEVGYTIELLTSNDREEVEALLKKYAISMIVIDHYGIGYKYEKELKTKHSELTIMALDDTYERHYCDILLNHNISADAKRYKELVPKECELRCGSEYTLLRKEFYQKFPQKKKSEYINVLVAMGGVDSRELNRKILEVCSKFETIKIDVLTTTANKNLHKLQEFVKNSQNITLLINSTEVAKLMHKSDFAILTPSVTVNEAYFMKLPFIAIKSEKNQEDIYAYLQNKSIFTLESFDVEKLSQKIELMIAILSSKLTLFGELSLEEKKMILAWRNSQSVRKWMYNRDTISLENHLHYIASLSKREDKVYFLLQNEKSSLGVVDLTEIKDQESAEIGIYSDPNLKGYGTLLMYKIVEYAFNVLRMKVLYAHVYEENIKAIELYKKFHFKTIATTKDSNGKLQSMELKHEDWYI